LFGRLHLLQKIVAHLELKPGMRILDVGCGIGGGPFYMATTFGVKVDGVDLCAHSLEYAQQKLETSHGHLKEQVSSIEEAYKSIIFYFCLI
jgi:cyclopropane fatty-acyl-phospholipid synthase-like methyltransferase